MAECSKDILIPVPVEMEAYSVGYTMDIGGSVAKLMYRSKEKLPPKDGLSQRIRIAYLKRDDIDNMAAFIRERCDTPEHNAPIQITTTGVGGTQYADQLNEKLNVRVENADEMTCFVRGFKCLSKQLPDAEFFYPLPREAVEDALPIVRGFLPMMMAMTRPVEAGNDLSGKGLEVPEEILQSLDLEHILATYGKDTPRTPCGLAMCGSGCAMQSIPDINSKTFDLIGYTPQAGRHMMGLGRLLTGAKSYDELMSLAEQGDSSQVNTHCRDLRGGAGVEDMYSSMPGEALSFTFGKAMDNDIDTFRREDLAAAVVRNSLAGLVQFVMTQAQASDIHTAYFCGAMIDHPLARRVLASAFIELGLMEQRPEKKVTMKMARFGTYIGAVGAWLLGMEKEAEKNNNHQAKNGGKQTKNC